MSHFSAVMTAGKEGEMFQAYLIRQTRSQTQQADQFDKHGREEGAAVEKALLEVCKCKSSVLLRSRKHHIFEVFSIGGLGVNNLRSFNVLALLCCAWGRLKLRTVHSNCIRLRLSARD